MVFCKNCKWYGTLYRSLTISFMYDMRGTCLHKSNIKILYDWKGQFKNTKENPEYINQSNNCKNYKRKWWKCYRTIKRNKKTKCIYKYKKMDTR